jgi:hypothetical protein
MFLAHLQNPVYRHSVLQVSLQSPVRDYMLVENRRLTPRSRPVRDGMWILGGTFRPAGTVHRGDDLFLPTYCPYGTSRVRCRDAMYRVSARRRLEPNAIKLRKSQAGASPVGAHLRVRPIAGKGAQSQAGATNRRQGRTRRCAPTNPHTQNHCRAQQ